MTPVNNYAIQAQQAKTRFLTYDQQALIQKFHLKAEDAYLYLSLFSEPCRISRTTGDIQRQTGGAWVDANSFGEVMTLLDLLCDSREDRCLSGRLKNMTSFGLMFHQNLLEDARDPWAEAFQAQPEAFCAACKALGGKPFPQGDIAYTIELFDGLCIVLQLWLGDEEFPPNLRMLWDENTTQYIRYETMHYARGLLLGRIREKMTASLG